MDIVIPNLAESVTEGDLGAWLKKDGERVEKDDLILELETDKATVELAAEASGTLEILVQAGETVHVGDVVGRIVEEGAGKPRREAAREREASRSRKRNRRRRRRGQGPARAKEKPEAKKEEPPEAHAREGTGDRKTKPETRRRSRRPEERRNRRPVERRSRSRKAEPAAVASPRLPRPPTSPAPAASG